MAVYRLYFMDGFSGHIVDFVQFRAAQDSDAVQIAEKRRRPVAMELWCRSRKIQRWEPEFANSPAMEPQFVLTG